MLKVKDKLNKILSSGWTKEEVALEIGATPESIERWATGYCQPRSDKKKELCEFLKENI